MSDSGQIINLASHATVFDWAQLVALFLSVLVAGLAAWYAVRESRRNQERSEFSVSPAIVFHQDAKITQETVSVTIANAGNGPAIIDDIYVIYRGMPVQTTGNSDWLLVMDQLITEKYSRWIPEVQGLQLNTGGMNRGEILGAGGKQNIASSLYRSQNLTEEKRYIDFVFNIEVIVFYHSVHGRYFVSGAPYKPEGNLEASESSEEWLRKHRPSPAEHTGV